MTLYQDRDISSLHIYCMINGAYQNYKKEKEENDWKPKDHRINSLVFLRRTSEILIISGDHKIQFECGFMARHR